GGPEKCGRESRKQQRGPLRRLGGSVEGGLSDAGDCGTKAGHHEGNDYLASDPDSGEASCVAIVADGMNVAAGCRIAEDETQGNDNHDHVEDGRPEVSDRPAAKVQVVVRDVGEDRLAARIPKGEAV